MSLRIATAAFLAALLGASNAGARSSAPGAAGTAFAVAYGAAAYSVSVEPAGDLDRITVRRLGLDGGVLWQRSYGSGRAEMPVGAAVTSGGGISVAGDDSAGCFAAHWGSEGMQKWSVPLQFGAECHVRAVLVDAAGDTYVLATTTLGDGFQPNVWKIDKRGSVAWSYRPPSSVSRYAFALTLDAAGDGVTTTAAASSPGGWIYDSFDLDSFGRPR